MMDEALAFMYKLDANAQVKVTSHLQRAKAIQDPEIYKKSQKTPKHEIEKAERIRSAFIKMKQNEKK